MIGKDAASLGALVRRYRQNAAISQEELADRSGISVRTISDLERGIRETARLDTIRLLAEGLALGEEDRTTLISAAVEGASGETDAELRFESALPLVANHLVGREGLVDQIVELLAEHRHQPVTLTGPGGVGKTRAGIEAASRYAERAGIPVAFVPLATIADREMVATSVARVLNVQLTASDPVERVGVALARRPVLLFLDNFEHLLAAAPVVARWLETAPDVRVLITSRARLRLSREREVSVPPLGLPEIGEAADQIAGRGAVQLFVERARDTGVRLETDEAALRIAAEICRGLDGLPLAIELAAAKTRVMPLSTLHEMLDRQLSLLTGGNRDQPGRLQSMREAIAWSYDLLTPDHQRLFRWLSPWLGGFSLTAMEQTALALGLDRVEAIQALEVLVDNAMVQRVHRDGVDVRFRILELIRAYGIEQLELLGERDEAQLQFARACYAIVADGAPSNGAIIDLEWTKRTETEIGNAVAAFDWVCRPEHAELALEFAAVIGPYWMAKGPFREAKSRMHRALQVAPSGYSSALVRSLIWAVEISMYSGDARTAHSYAERALLLALEAGTERELACSLTAWGWILEASEEWSDAAETLSRARKLWSELGEDFPQGNILMWLGGISCALGDFESARGQEMAAASIFAECGALDWQAYTEWYLGFIELAEGDVAGAARRFHTSLEYGITDRVRHNIHKPIIHLAGIAVRLGDYESAATLLGIGDRLLAENGEVLFAFDIPTWGAATESCGRELGEPAFNEMHANGSLGPSDWLKLSERVAEKAKRAAAEKSGLSSAVIEHGQTRAAMPEVLTASRRD